MQANSNSAEIYVSMPMCDGFIDWKRTHLDVCGYSRDGDVVRL